MIALLALALPLAELPGDDAARFAACTALVRSDNAAAIVQAEQWATRTPIVPARHCLGLAYAAAGRWTPAALTFEQAARDAAARRDGRAADLWVQAGNAALAADDPARARTAFDEALRLPGLPRLAAGEAAIDRARADYALGDLAQARVDLDRGLALVPEDPFAWLLSATLARKQNDLIRAQTDIDRTLKLAADDPAAQLEAGNIAAAAGDRNRARQAWTRAAQLAPETAEGKAAGAALAQEQPGP
jgi:tetratricopeptide (TPR) repeat protein